MAREEEVRAMFSAMIDAFGRLDRKVSYPAGKIIFMKSIAQEVARLKIRVNALSPGGDPHADERGEADLSEVFESALLGLIPGKRIGEPEDAASAAVWLASDESDYVNGTTI